MSATKRRRGSEANHCSILNFRKLFNCGGFGLEGLFFLFVARSTTAVTLFEHMHTQIRRLLILFCVLRSLFIYNWNSKDRCTDSTDIWRGVQRFRNIWLQCQSLRYSSKICQHSDGHIEWHRNSCRHFVSKRNRLFNKRSGNVARFPFFDCDCHVLVNQYFI